MILRRSCLALLLALALPVSSALAQATGPVPPAAPAPTTLESLFQRLRAAKDPNEGRAIAKQIEQRWLRSPSDTANLLMARVNQAMTANARETGIELIDYILQLQPQWAEAYNKRATLLFLMDDYDGALRDIRSTLAHEPRHFGALAGRGMIYEAMDKPDEALAAYREALTMNPYMAGVTDKVKLLEKLRPDI